MFDPIGGSRSHGVAARGEEAGETAKPASSSRRQYGLEETGEYVRKLVDVWSPELAADFEELWSSPNGELLYGFVEGMPAFLQVVAGATFLSKILKKAVAARSQSGGGGEPEWLRAEKERRSQKPAAAQTVDVTQFRKPERPSE